MLICRTLMGDELHSNCLMSFVNQFNTNAGAGDGNGERKGAVEDYESNQQKIMNAFY